MSIRNRKIVKLSVKSMVSRPTEWRNITLSWDNNMDDQIVATSRCINMWSL